MQPTHPPVPEPGAPPVDLDALYRDEVDYVWNSLRRLGVPSADLEDLAHDVFVVVHRKLPTFEPGRRVRPWLFGICFRLASELRQRAARTELGAEERAAALADESPGADESLAAQQRRALVRTALLAVPVDQRAVLVMHDLDGHTMPEISAELEVGLNTLYSRLRLGRAAFAAAVARCSPAPERGSR